MTGEAFRLIVAHELAADAEHARLQWRVHERRCWRRRLFMGRCADCVRLEQRFLAALRRLCDGAVNVILR